jgi:hypothetical protein
VCWHFEAATVRGARSAFARESSLADCWFFLFSALFLVADGVGLAGCLAGFVLGNGVVLTYVRFFSVTDVKRKRCRLGGLRVVGEEGRC